MMGGKTGISANNVGRKERIGRAESASEFECPFLNLPSFVGRAFGKTKICLELFK